MIFDLPTIGANNTWSNGHLSSDHTQKRLDRFVCNMDWFSLCFTTSFLTHTKIKSDHFPLLFDFKIPLTPFQSNLKFMTMWSTHDSCLEIIRNSWSNTVVRCPMSVLSEKLRILKSNLKAQNSNLFGNVHTKVKEA